MVTMRQLKVDGFKVLSLAADLISHNKDGEREGEEHPSQVKALGNFWFPRSLVVVNLVLDM